MLQHQSGLWLNKKGDMMAFLKLNDTEVESISFQNLDTTSTITGPSSGFGELKYAKVSHNSSLLTKIYKCCLSPLLKGCWFDFGTDNDRLLGLFFAFSVLNISECYFSELLVTM